MRVLVAEDRLGSSTSAIAELLAAGHEILRCQPLGATVHPCLGLAGGLCPLHSHVDVAVVVHMTPSRRAVVTREFGAVCAARAGVPIVAVARPADNPLPGVPATTGESLAATVERVSAQGTRPSTAELAVLARHAIQAGGRACPAGAVNVTYADGPTSYDVIVTTPTISPFGRRAVEARLRTAIEFDGDRHRSRLRDVLITATRSARTKAKDRR